MNENPHRIVADAAGAEAVAQFEQHQHTTPPTSIQSRGTLLDWALAYIRRGWAPIPIPEGKKKPIIRGWPEFRFSETDVPAHFRGRGNIGIILGRKSGGLTDVDLDCREAIELAGKALPATRAIFGRASKPGSHRLYRVEGRAPTMQFSDPITGAVLLEIRGDGGLQTVFPPSIHPSGEAIEWAEDGDPISIEAAALIKSAQFLAGFCLIKRYCPSVTGAAGLPAALDAIDPIHLCVVDQVRKWLDLPGVRSERSSELGKILQEPDYVRSRPSRGLAERSRRNLGGPEWTVAEERRCGPRLRPFRPTTTRFGTKSE